MPVETFSRFPVMVRVARNDEDRRKVFALRALSAAPASAGKRAAGSHGAAPAGALHADACDARGNATLLLAQSAIDGEVLGSLRILTSERGRLMIDGRVELPARLKQRSLAEASRLVVKDGRHAQLVRMMLWKAFHRYCLAAQIDTMLIAVREPADQEYEWLGFSDALPGEPRFALREGGDAPTYRLMSLDVLEAHQRMRQLGHPLHDFFFVERHPEIDLLSPVAGNPRARNARAQTLPDHARIAAELEQVAIV